MGELFKTYITNPKRKNNFKKGKLDIGKFHVIDNRLCLIVAKYDKKGYFMYRGLDNLGIGHCITDKEV